MATKKANKEQQQNTVVAQPVEDRRYWLMVSAEIGPALATFLLLRYVDFKVQWREKRFVFRVSAKHKDILNEQVSLMEKAMK